MDPFSSDATREHDRLRERLKELHCLYTVERALGDADRAWTSAMERVLEAVPLGFRHPELAGCRIELEGERWATPSFQETEWGLRYDVTLDGEALGRVEVAYKNTPPEPGPPFVPEEGELLAAIASRIGQAWRSRRRWSDLQLLEQALDSAAHPVLITDREGRIEWVNTTFTETTGFSREEALGRDPGELLRSEKQSAEFYENLWQTILRGHVWRGRLFNRRKDGTVYPEDQTITPVRDASGRITHFIAVKVDLSEHDELTEQLREAQKMEAMGRLASGVAHDLNNLFTIIRGHSEMILGELSEDSPVAPDVRGLLEGVEAGAALTRQLLAANRKQRPQQTAKDLGSLVTSVQPLLRRLLPERIDLQVHTGESTRPIWIDPVQMHQVLFNLVVNAGDAIDGVGAVTLSVGERRLSRSDADVLPWKVEPGRYAELRVEDDGNGMDPEVKQRVFEPFFTTKPDGEGTGLGLAIVFGIMKQSGGHILVDSEAGKGTTIRLLFPLLERAEAEGEDAREPVQESDASAGEALMPQTGGDEGRDSSGGREPSCASEPSARKGTILLVEDDAAIQRLARRALTRAGHEILAASDGRKALEMSRERGGEIDLVVSDVVTPGMADIELADGLRGALPHCPLILMSGYSVGELSEGVVQESDTFLQKPFAPADLVRTVDAVLADANPS